MEIIYMIGFIMGILAHLPLFVLKETILKKQNKILTKDVILKMSGLIVINIFLILLILWLIPLNTWASIIAIIISIIDAVGIMTFVICTKYFEPK